MILSKIGKDKQNELFQHCVDIIEALGLFICKN